MVLGSAASEGSQVFS